MATLLPFQALRPTPQTAPLVAAVPYDVVSTDEARALAAGNALSFLHVSRAEIDLPAGTDPYASAVYEAAACRFDALKREAPLVREQLPSLYLYRLTMGSAEQIGVAGCYALDGLGPARVRDDQLEALAVLGRACFVPEVFPSSLKEPDHRTRLADCKGAAQKSSGWKVLKV